MVSKFDTYLNPEELRKEKKFKAEVLYELDQLQTMPTAQSFLDEYLEGLRTIHSQFRASTAQKVAEAEQCILKAFEKYSEFSGKSIGLEVSRKDNDGSITGCFPLTKAPILMRDFYEAKNPCKDI